MTISALYIKISQASVLLPIIIGLMQYKSLTRPFKVLFYFFLICAFVEVKASFSISKYVNNMPDLHVYTVLEFLAFSIVFYLQSQKNSIARRLIGINIAVFIMVAIFDVLSYGIYVSNDLSRSYSSASMLIYTLCYLYYLFTIDDTRYMWEYPMFWLCTGVLIYFGGNILYFMIRRYLVKEQVSIEWGNHLFHAALNIIAYCLYAQSFRCLKKQKMASLSSI